MSKYFLVLVCITLVASCKKSELKKYEEPDMVYIYQDAFNTSKDSITYSFAVRPAGVLVDTVKIPLRIMGLAKDKDRVVNARIVKESSTAVEGKHFTLLPAVIKANEYTGYVPVLVKRTTDLKTTEMRMVIEITESADFKPGVPASAAQSPRAGGTIQFLVKVNDYLTKPANWDSQLVFYFGTFSQVKYAFVIGVTGRSEFIPGSGVDNVSTPQLTYYKVLCKNALSEYNATHPVLTDEFGLTVSFPN